VPEMLDRATGYARYPSKTHALHWQVVITTITFVWYVKKWLYYGT